MTLGSHPFRSNNLLITFTLKEYCTPCLQEDEQQDVQADVLADAQPAGPRDDGPFAPPPCGVP